MGCYNQDDEDGGHEREEDDADAESPMATTSSIASRSSNLADDPARQPKLLPASSTTCSTKS